MILCENCYLLLLLSYALVSAESVGLLDTPIMLDYTALLKRDSSGSWEASGFDPLPFDRPEDMRFDYNAALSEDGSVKLSWNFNNDNITFKISARTLGWISIGISDSGNSLVDYAVIGHKDQVTYITDMHGEEDGVYVLDSSHDLNAMYSWETQDETYAIFSRPLVTCDRQGDVDITADTLKILWAFGDTDAGQDLWQGEELTPTKSGDLRLKLLNPMLPPPELQLPEASLESLTVAMPNIHVKAEEYRHCVAFRFSNLGPSKHHIVQFEPQITSGNEYNVRQIIVRQCSGKSLQLRSAQQAESDCYDPKTSAECKTIVLSWSLGMSSFSYPENVGYPIGRKHVYFVLEVRYINQHIPDLLDSSGVKIHYTPHAREFDAGVMTTGSLVRESQIIPPRSSKFVLQGHCMKQCLALAVPTGKQVTIFAALLHAQDLGRKIRLRHFRGGKELAPVAEDNHFYAMNQETQVLTQEVQLLKGDNMIVECTYDTQDRNEITYVNNSIGGESCLAFLSYYPRFEKLTDCETAPLENVVMDTVGAARLEEVKRSAEKFEWTEQQSREYNTRLLSSQVYVSCGNSLLEEPQPVPEIITPYVKKQKCKMEAEEIDPAAVAAAASTATSITTSNQSTTSTASRLRFSNALFALTVLYVAIVVRS